MYKLTVEGLKYFEGDLPEKRLLKILIDEAKPMAEIVKLENSQIAVGWARKSGWIKIEKGNVSLTDEGQKALRKETPIEAGLKSIKQSGKVDDKTLKVLLARNLVEETKEEVKEKEGFLDKIFKKKKISVEEIKEIAQLTPEIIKSGKWKNVPFRNYDINAPSPTMYLGKKQPYVQFIEGFKDKLIGLGYKEIQGGLVETSFWNCDALFMPSDHPARGIHDILLLKNPKTGKLPDPDIVAKVKATHEGGWITGSSGWGNWDETCSKQLAMRSQTTAVSVRTLKENGEKPGKYFCIGKCFRHDVIDANHLPEFLQFDGIIIDKDLNFQNLLGALKGFANMIGIEKIKFVPSYFPFTEPSVEMYAYFPDKGWIEVGGAGIFRPEVVRPLGIENYQVLAWGLGIGRLAMLALGIKDIRQLYSDDINWLRKKEMVK